jgi:hypothetical protein
MYGEEYKTRVEHPHQVIIQQSEPFRMRFPEEQAKMFRLLSGVLYYVVSGYSKVGYLAADEWNPYYQAKYGIRVRQAPVCADSQTTRMYECVIVKPRRANHEELYADGILNGESDEEPEDWILNRARSITSSTRRTGSYSDGSWDSRGASPMDESQN